MKLKIVYPEGKFYAFDLVDDDTGEKVGTIVATQNVTDHLPTVDSMTKFQGAKVVIDGKSLKRLQREVSEYAQTK